MPTMNRIALAGIALLAINSAMGQRQPPTPAQAINNNFTGLNQKVLEMAQDFPADKYDYRPAAGLRSFGEVVIHIASGNNYGARAGRGEQVKWDDLEMDAKNFKSKAETVAALQKSITDATASLKATPAEQFSKTLAPWLAVIEHEAEHYGQLVVYYRVAGLVPPESRPKK
jgi:uncharacterized damage-inducible protein DinB